MTNPNMRLRRNLIASSCLAMAGALALPLAARADDAGAEATSAAAAATSPASTTTTVQTITVTAERREVDIQKAPLAISSVASKRLDQSFITNVAGLNGVVPGLQVTKASGFENLVTIRGVGSETPENSLTTVPGVSEFVDGVYIANTISLDQTLFDIDNIQVLRGPQGALYGESSIGGSILINTKQPRLHAWDGQADFSAGTYDLFRERAEVNIPLGDDFALRLSGQKFDHSGFTNDVLIPGFRLDDQHDVSGKAALLWKPNDQFTATFTAQGYYADQNGDAQKNINDPSPDPRVVFQDYPAHFRLQNDLFHLNLELDEPGFIVKSITGYQYLAHQQREDGTRSAFALIQEYDDVAAWDTWVYNFTEEFDVMSPADSKVQWDVGAFYLNQKSHQFVAEFQCLHPAPFGNPANCTAPTAADVAVPPDIETNPPSNLAYGNDSHATHWTAAVFGQFTYPVTDQLRVTAGVRYNHDFDADPSFNFHTHSEGPPSFTNNTISTDEVTWRAEGDYDLTPDNLVYGSVSRGYKPGAANGFNPTAVLLTPTAKPETNTAFEIGSKNLFLDRTLRLNASAFYYIHDNFQYIETDPFPFDAGLANIPRVDDYGVEFEGNYVSPDSKLHIDGSLALERGRVVGRTLSLDSTTANVFEGPNFTGLNETDFVHFIFGPCAFSGAFYNPACWAQVKAAAVNIQGNQPPAMPNVSGSVSVAYDFDTSIGTFTPRVEVVYRGSEWARIFNDVAVDKVPAYTVVNLNLDFAPKDPHWHLALAATNVGDVAGITSRYTDPFGTFMTSNQYIPPLQVIGTIGYKY